MGAGLKIHVAFISDRGRMNPIKCISLNFRMKSPKCSMMCFLQKSEPVNKSLYNFWQTLKITPQRVNEYLFTGDG